MTPDEERAAEVAAAMARVLIERYVLSHPPDELLHFPLPLREQVAECPLCDRDDDGELERACALHIGVILGLAMARDEGAHTAAPSRARQRKRRP
jgi:hypothetical protein